MFPRKGSINNSGRRGEWGEGDVDRQRRDAMLFVGRRSRLNLECFGEGNRDQSDCAGVLCNTDPVWHMRRTAYGPLAGTEPDKRPSILAGLEKASGGPSRILSWTVRELLAMR